MVRKKAVNTSNPSTLAKKFIKLETAVDGELQERGDQTHTAILALISKKHHFQVGPPGIAKSLLVERIVKRINGFDEGGYFHRLLTKYTTDDELFGAPDMGKLMNESLFQRNTDRRLPVAHIAFLDEIFKGNSSVLNALLLAMNERMYDDDVLGPISIPLISIFAASNELPEGEELNAMYDRLHLRHLMNPIQDGSSFVSMMESNFKEPDPILSLNDIKNASVLAKEVIVPRSVIDSLRELRGILGQAGIEPTDRRWRNSLDVIQASAWLEGCDHAEVRHTRALMHMMWDRVEDIKKVQNLVLDLADPLERQAQEYFDKLLKLESDFREAMEDTEAQKSKSSIAVEIYSKMEKLNEKRSALEKKIESTSSRKMKILQDFERRFKEVSLEVMHAGFGIDADNLPKNI